MFASATQYQQSSIDIRRFLFMNEVLIDVFFPEFYIYFENSPFESLMEHAKYTSFKRLTSFRFSLNCGKNILVAPRPFISPFTVI